jgi:hypothetical protein
MMQWLLQKKLIVQLRTYFYLLDPMTNRVCSVHDDDMAETVARIVTHKPIAVADMFRRIYIYFDGYHTMEEILWMEALNWSDMAVILDQFRNVLVLCLHE